MSAEGKLGGICGALVGGEMLGRAADACAVGWPLPAALAALVALLGFGFSARHWHLAFFLLLGLALALRAQDAQNRVRTDVALAHGRLSERFEVLPPVHVGKPDEHGLRWVTFPSRFAHRPLKIMIRQSARAPLPLAGETWHCTGWLKDDDSVRQLWVQGAGSSCTRLRPVRRLRAAFSCLKHDFARRLAIGLADRPLLAALHRAMILGERAAIPPRLRTAFIRSGTIHVFAISGLHVGAVATLLAYLLLLLAVPLRWIGLALVPVLWFYVELIGAPASAVRAAAMTSVCCLAPIFWQRPNLMTAWEVTLIGFALLDPIGLFGIGSLLSFSVMLGILLFLRWARPFRSRVLLFFGVPFAAWAAGVPITAHVFARITPGGLLANLAMIPLAGASVLTSVVGVMLSYASERLAGYANNLAALFTEMMTGVAWAVARIPGADLEILPWPISLCVAWYAGILLLFVWIKMVYRRRRGRI